MSGNYPAFRDGPSHAWMNTRRSSESLADVLERVLDKGVVVAGDVVVNLLDIELLTLKVRLLICSLDTAQSIGIDWWRTDPFLTGDRTRQEQQRELEARVERLEARVGPPRQEARHE